MLRVIWGRRQSATFNDSATRHARGPALSRSPGVFDQGNLLTADHAAAVIYVIGATGPFPEMQELL